jgi:putative sterol carrier protein
MAHPFPSEEWTHAFAKAVNDNPAYREAGKTWTHGTVAMVVEKEPSLDLDEEVGMILDVHAGECRGARYVKGLAAAMEAPFVIVAKYDRWKEVIRGELDPTKAMMQGKLKMVKGNLPVMLSNVQASNQLVVSATKVDTEFLD